MNNLRKGFSLPELAFIIMLISVMSAMTVPKIFNDKNDTKISNFLNKLNNITGKNLWEKSISDKKEGHISSYCNNIRNYIKIPESFKTSNDCCFIIKSATGSISNIIFKDGDSTHRPMWSFK